MSKITTTIMIVDDHPLFRKGLQRLISFEDDLEIINEFSSGRDAIEGALRDDPDLIILDLNMQGIDGIETLRVMREKGVTSKIIILSVSDNEDDVLAAMKNGADGYLLKDMEPEDIIDNIKQAALGKLALSDRLTNVITESWSKPLESHKDLLKDLTERERQILALLAKGMSNKLMASKLKIKETTVKVHVKNLLKKLNLHSRLEAAVLLIDTKHN